jgi:hypothetical protein
MTVAMLPMLRKAEAPNVTVIASIAGLANQRYVVHHFTPYFTLRRVSCISTSTSLASFSSTRPSVLLSQWTLVIACSMPPSL